jgi:hypothetical protein
LEFFRPLLAGAGGDISALTNYLKSQMEGVQVSSQQFSSKY